MHPNATLLFQRYGQDLFASNLRVLEIGPDRHPSTFQSLVCDPTIRWETLDLVPHEGLTYVADGEYRFPVPDDTFDIVFSSQVIEHVRKVWVWIKEVARVCKPGGHVVTINPVSWPYHEAPVDCWRIYPEGMRALYGEAGLEVKLSKFETLETRGVKRGRILPGGSIPPSLAASIKKQIKQLIGWPIVCAYDTITIGVKSGSVGARSWFPPS